MMLWPIAGAIALVALLQAASLVLDATNRWYRRLSATLAADPLRGFAMRAEAPWYVRIVERLHRGEDQKP